MTQLKRTERLHLSHLTSWTALDPISHLILSNAYRQNFVSNLAPGANVGDWKSEQGIYNILCGLPLRSVETPVEKSPRDATAKEPPKSTVEFSNRTN